MRLLIDGDIILYRSAAACVKLEYIYREKGKEEDGPVASFRYKRDAKAWLNGEEELYVEEKKVKLDPVEHCYYSIKNTINSIIKASGINPNVEIYVGGEDNFRLDVDPEYKQGRPPRPPYFDDAFEYMVDHMGAIVVNGMETDDVLGIEQAADSCIVSIDKDLLQIPGAHYNYVNDSAQFVTKQEANDWFWNQLMTGDGVDNIPGLFNIGPSRAADLVDTFPDRDQLEGFIRGAYLDEFPDDPARFNKNVKLLYIRRTNEDLTVEQILEKVQ